MKCIIYVGMNICCETPCVRVRLIACLQHSGCLQSIQAEHHWRCSTSTERDEYMNTWTSTSTKNETNGNREMEKVTGKSLKQNMAINDWRCFPPPAVWNQDNTTGWNSKIIVAVWWKLYSQQPRLLSTPWKTQMVTWSWLRSEDEWRCINCAVDWKYESLLT